jgi:predicted nucleic acid-binding protein
MWGEVMAEFKQSDRVRKIVRERYVQPAIRAEHLLRRSRDRGDSLFTSHLVVGELLAGSKRLGVARKNIQLREALREMRFSFLPFDAGAAETFSDLRGTRKIKVADSINLSCAASARMDLFLTVDQDLVKLDVNGIQFIADFQTPVL